MKKTSFFGVYQQLAMVLWATVPVLFCLNLVLGVIHGISHAFGTLAFQRFFDSVGTALDTNSSFRTVYFSLAFLGSVIIFKEVLNGVHNFLSVVLEEKMLGQLSLKIHAKAGKIDPLNFEQPAFLDEINKAKQGAEVSLYLAMVGSIVLTFYTPYFIFMTAYLYWLKPVLAWSVVLVFVPVGLTQLVRSTVFTKLEDEAAPLRREYEYYERCLVDREYFKETRQLGAYRFFKDLYHSTLVALQKKQWNAELRTGLLELGMKIITLLGYGGVLYLLITALLQGEITVGSFAAVFGSLSLMFNLMEEILVRHATTVSKGLGSVANFFDFLARPERQGQRVELDFSDGVVMKDVSFTYPGASTPSLRRINLELRPGETLAIVGQNGAGKTTLVRVLTGLYLPCDGDVFIGKQNTRGIALNSIFQGVSAVFQRYQRYQMTCEENVTISEPEKFDQQHLEGALSKTCGIKSRGCTEKVR